MDNQQQDNPYYCTVSYKCETCASSEGLNFLKDFCIDCDGTGWIDKKITVKDFLNLADSKKNNMHRIDYEKML